MHMYLYPITQRRSGWLAGLFLLLSVAVSAQVSNRLHITQYNGLPSNYVYSTAQDHHGYLWICTDNGLVCYNGYSFRIYNTADGLPSREIFSVREDRKHRLWLFSIADRLGYIYDHKYHPVSQGEGQESQVFDNRNLIDDGDRTWVSRVYWPPGSHFVRQALYLLQNDSLVFSGLLFNQPLSGRPGELFDFDGDLMNPDGGWRKVIRYSRHGKQETGTIFFSSISEARQTTVGKYLFLYWPSNNSHELKCLDLLNPAAGIRTMEIVDEQGRKDEISMVIDKEGLLYIVCKNNVHVMDSNWQICRRYPIVGLTGEADTAGEGMVADFDESSIWGTCTSTRNKGLYINFGTQRRFSRLTGVDLSDYTFLGSYADSLCFWWRNKDRSLVTITAGGAVVRAHYPQLLHLVRIVAVPGGTPLLISKVNIYPVRQVFPLVPGNAYHCRMFVNDRPLGTSVHGLWRRPYVRNAVAVDTDNFYFTGYGLYRCHRIGDSLLCHRISPYDRYYGMEPDSVRGGLWMYNNEKAFFYAAGGRKLFFREAFYKKYGISNIGRLIPHTASRTLFLSDDAHLFAISAERGIQSLFPCYNLEGAKLHISGDLIVLAGRFGILFSRILGGGRYGTPVVYRNIRNSAYSQVSEIAVIGGKVVLSTDKHVYMVPVPGRQELLAAQPDPPPFRLFLRYRDTLHAVPSTRTLQIVNEDTRIRLDVINPLGNGNPVFHYSLDGGAWQRLNGSELDLHMLRPGRQYRLSMMVNDDALKSGAMSVTLYKVPLWWQRRDWQTVFWVGGILGAALLLLGVVLLTRYLVIRAGRRRAFLNSLELRAIYAQINPHFIFNTLNTALFFIRRRRNEEAFAHVSKFSKLLRSYLSSSRRRYLSIAEEIVNLRHYIDLQRTRFGDHFRYEISVQGLEPSEEFIPSLLLQPIVENAVNHGLVPREKGGYLFIGFRKEEATGHIICTVDDNGIGRARAKELRSRDPHRESFGGKLIQELITIFNKYEKTGIGLEYFDKAPPETGTRVIITIRNQPYD